MIDISFTGDTVTLAILLPLDPLYAIEAIAEDLMLSVESRYRSWCSVFMSA